MKEHKKIIIVALLLVLLITVAAIIYGSSAKTTVNASVTSRTPNETKLMTVLSEIEGVGKSEVMITEEGDNIVGVIVVCQGAENIATKNDVINAVRTAFKIEKSNIAIYAMK